MQDSLAEIFSIIVTLDELEKAFLKDAIPESDYTEICERSLKQYKSILADEGVSKAFVGLEEFKAEWEVCAQFSSHSSFLRIRRDTGAERWHSSRSHERPSEYVWGCPPLP